MLDVEVVDHPAVQAVQDRAASSGVEDAVLDDVNGQDRHAGGDGPGVQVVGAEDTGDAFDVRADLV